MSIGTNVTAADPGEGISRAVVQVQPVGLQPVVTIVPDHQVQVAIPIHVPQGHGSGRVGIVGDVTAADPGEGIGCAVVQKQLVVAAIVPGHQVQVAIPVHVAQGYRTGTIETASIDLLGRTNQAILICLIEEDAKLKLITWISTCCCRNDIRGIPSARRRGNGHLRGCGEGQAVQIFVKLAQDGVGLGLVGLQLGQDAAGDSGLLGDEARRHAQVCLEGMFYAAEVVQRVGLGLAVEFGGNRDRQRTLGVDSLAEVVAHRGGVYQRGARQDVSLT